MGKVVQLRWSVAERRAMEDWGIDYLSERLTPAAGRMQGESRHTIDDSATVPDGYEFVEYESDND